MEPTAIKQKRRAGKEPLGEQVERQHNTALFWFSLRFSRGWRKEGGEIRLMRAGKSLLSVAAKAHAVVAQPDRATVF